MKVKKFDLWEWIQTFGMLQAGMAQRAVAARFWVLPAQSGASGRNLRLLTALLIVQDQAPSTVLKMAGKNDHSSTKAAKRLYRKAIPSPKALIRCY